MLALSTSWNAKKYTSSYGDGEKLLDEVSSIGFNSIELNIDVPENVYREIHTGLEKRNISVSSIHNFFPRIDAPPGRKLLNAYLLSSPDIDEREKAIKFTKKTIDYASCVNAKAVVIHFGLIETNAKAARLIELYNNELQNTDEFILLRERLLKEREKKQKIYLANALKSLGIIAEYAKCKKIKIGLESRFHYEEIPNFEEVGFILDKFKGDTVYYWHDMGHAQVAENLGFSKHEDFLKHYSDRMLGVHIHDIVKCVDHKAPGTGNMDFNMLKKYLKERHIKVVELSSRVTKEEVVNSLNFLRTLQIA